jgi:hypothetical protein
MQEFLIEAINKKEQNDSGLRNDMRGMGFWTKSAMRKQ